MPLMSARRHRTGREGLNWPHCDGFRTAFAIGGYATLSITRIALFLVGTVIRVLAAKRSGRARS